MTRRIDELFARYGESHRNPANKAIHWVCVPLITWSVIALLWSWTPIAAYALIAASIAFYALLSPVIAVGMLGVSAALVYPLTLLGTHARPVVVAALRRFDRVHVLLDDDPPGRAAGAALAAALGLRAVVVPLPGAADPAELALVPGGAALLRAAAARSRLAAAA